MKSFSCALGAAAATVLLVSAPGAGAAAATVKAIYTFCPGASCPDGAAPYGRLTFDQAGNIFGTTGSGGDQDKGVVFELTHNAGDDSWTYHRIYSFCARSGCTDGDTPSGYLVLDTAGNIYGTTRFGSLARSGTAFRLTPKGGSWTLKTLYTFCSDANCADGNQPIPGLTYLGEASGVPYDGVSPLFGVTETGGKYNRGTLFQLTNHGSRWKHHTLHDFCPVDFHCRDGELPITALTDDGAGHLLGSSDFGGDHNSSTIFEMSSTNGRRWKLRTLYSFCSLNGCADGELVNRMVLDAAGTIYGTTASSGAHNGGTLFRFKRHAGQPSNHGGFAVLYDFCRKKDCIDGATPRAGVTIDASGNLWGTTFNGGGHDGCWDVETCGTAFEYSGRKLTVVHAFCSEAGCAEGSFPSSDLASDGSGNLFGEAEVGGYGHGTIYELTP